MANEKVIREFTNTVKDLSLAVNLRIEAKDYTYSRVMLGDMEVILKKIVTSMFLHGDINSFESEMIMTFIRYNVADKLKLIQSKEREKYMEYKEDNSAFEQAEEKWKEYTTPSNEEPNDSKTHQISHRLEPDDDEEDL